MTDAADRAPSAATPDARALRAVRVIRAALLLVVGLAIAFTAPMHEDLEFVRWSLIAGLALVGLATVGEYLVLRGTRADWLVALRAVVAFAAAVCLMTAPDTTAVALWLATWALANALIAVARIGLGTVARTTGLPSALLSAALAVALLLAREDAVALVGFFGAYAIVRGVFLGISAFDGRGGAAPVERRDIDPALGGPSAAL